MQSAQTVTLALALLVHAPLVAWADALDDAALGLFTAAFSQTCHAGFAEDGGPSEPPQRHDLEMPNSYGEPEPAILWQFLCNTGAYNLTSVFLVHTELDGLRPLALPVPVLTVTNEDPGNYESAVTYISISGWTAAFHAVNAGFDTESGRIAAFAKWRGLGDAWDMTEWELFEGGARIRRFEVDASYDDLTDPQMTQTFP